MSGYDFNQRGMTPTMFLSDKQGKTFLSFHINEDRSLVILSQNNGYDAVELTRDCIMPLVIHLLQEYEKMPK
jgi:hypothetical protein